MPEVKKNLEQSSQVVEKQESLSQGQEQRESFKIPEKVSETEEVQVSEEKNNISDDNQVASGQQQVVDSPMSDRLKKAVDNILEEGLEDIYLNLPKETQKEFKAKGEKTTNTINSLLSETKIKVKKSRYALKLAVRKKLSGGRTYDSLNKGQVKKIPLPLPLFQEVD